MGKNITLTAADGQKLGATGMLNTVWNDDGEGIFDENWFGVLFGVAAAWHVYAIAHPNVERLQAALAEADIGCKRYYATPVHRQPPMRPWV